MSDCGMRNMNTLSINWRHHRISITKLCTSVVWSPPTHHIPQQPMELDGAANSRYGSLPELPSQPAWTPKASPQSVEKEEKPINYKCHSSPVSRKEYLCNGKQLRYNRMYSNCYNNNSNNLHFLWTTWLVDRRSNRARNADRSKICKYYSTSDVLKFIKISLMLLNQEVEKPLQHEWYKRLFRTIHKPRENGNWEKCTVLSKLINIDIVT